MTASAGLEESMDSRGEVGNCACASSSGRVQIASTKARNDVESFGKRFVLEPLQWATVLGGQGAEPVRVTLEIWCRSSNLAMNLRPCTCPTGGELPEAAQGRAPGQGSRAPPEQERVYLPLQCSLTVLNSPPTKSYSEE